MARGKGNNNSKSNGATLGFEATLWAVADKLRNNMDAAEYKHVVLGLIFTKSIEENLLQMDVNRKTSISFMGSSNLPWMLNDKKFMGALE
jgi:type I restriction enzyme M protein